LLCFALLLFDFLHFYHKKGIPCTRVTKLMLEHFSLLVLCHRHYLGRF